MPDAKLRLQIPVDASYTALVTGSPSGLPMIDGSLAVGAAHGSAEHAVSGKHERHG